MPTDRDDRDRPSRPSDDDLSSYLLDEASAEALLEELAAFDKPIGRPELVERLKQLEGFKRVLAPFSGVVFRLPL